MKIANEFTVNAPVDAAWAVLSDPEQVIPLMPGAKLLGVDGQDFTGAVKVKVGPVTTEFSGKGTFLERDETQHRAVISGRGKESRGSGNAAATVTTELHQDGNLTRVTVDTDLKIVGKLAQFGSGTLQQISEKLLGEFVTALEVKLAGGSGPDATEAAAGASKGSTPAGTPGEAGAPKIAAVPPISTAKSAEPAPIDLLELAGVGKLKKYGVIAAGVIGVLAVLALIRALRHRR